MEDNIFSLYEDLKNKKYKHGKYTHFVFYDNKKRDIHKAEVRDRVVHQIIFDYLGNMFEPTFINDSYSSMNKRGSHRAVKTFRYFSNIEKYKNNNIFILKCDIKKYFGSIDQSVLLGLVKKRVKVGSILSVIKEIIESFKKECGKGKGIPLGNITSQIFANIYLNNLDHFVKSRLKQRFYIRYNDDFVLISKNKKRMEFCLEKIRIFISKLLLDLPTNKTSIRKLRWGIDFLGFSILSNCILLRNKTKQKVFEKVNKSNFQSYFAILRHCNSYRLKNKLTHISNSFSENL